MIISTTILVTYEQLYSGNSKMTLENEIERRFLKKGYELFYIESIESFKIGKYAEKEHIDYIEIPITLSATVKIPEKDVEISYLPDIRGDRLIVHTDWYTVNFTNITSTSKVNNKINSVILDNGERISNLTEPVKFKITDIKASTGLNNLDCDGILISDNRESEKNTS